jgi:hypothetical protein
MEKTDDKLQHLGNLNFKEFFHLFGKIQIKVFISLISSTLIFSIFIFKLGQLYQTRGEAISLYRLFDLTLELEKYEANNSKIIYSDIYLLESKDHISPIPDKAYLEIRKYTKANDTKKIGLIHAYKPDMKPVPRVSFPGFIKKAYANEKFEWYGHANDRNFTEKYTNQKTIRRYYDDGWILEYKVDKKRKSILSSFRWIKKGD